MIFVPLGLLLALPSEAPRPAPAPAPVAVAVPAAVPVPVPVPVAAPVADPVPELVAVKAPMKKVKRVARPVPQEIRDAPLPTNAVDAGRVLRDSVGTAIKLVVPKARKCWERALKDRPDLASARLQFAMTIHPQRDAAAEVVASALEGDAQSDVKLRKCMLSALADADIFLPAKAAEIAPEMDVIYPLVFKQ